MDRLAAERPPPPLSSGGGPSPPSSTLTLREVIEPIAAAPMDEGLRACVRGACEAAMKSDSSSHSSSYMEFHSAAIHDASPLAVAGIPSAMLFVPSVGGVSHTFDEHTEAADIAKGAEAFVAAAAGIVMQLCWVE